MESVGVTERSTLTSKSILKLTYVPAMRTYEARQHLAIMSSLVEKVPGSTAFAY